MTDFSEFDQRSKNYINGKISQFIDVYIRQHKVWLPEQMYEAFLEKISSLVSGGEFRVDYEHSIEIWNSEIADKWLVSEDAKSLIIKKMTLKYDKDKSIARADSPIVKRVRVGLSWRESSFFDISFGLNSNHLFIGTAALAKLPYKPWTVNHVEQQLKDLYQTSLAPTLTLLSTSPIEIIFYKYWLEHYYSQDRPALIPEVCGLDEKFYYYEYKNIVSATMTGLGSVDDFNNIKPKNFRFDFFVSNTKSKKAAFIELDGHEHHKTKQQRTVDSIKRNVAAKLNIPVIVFTGSQVNSNVSECFNSITELLS